MDRTAQWPKEESFGKPMEGINTRTRLLSEEKRAIRSPQEHLNCPRCNSTNTKFCYYNNYSLTQPRYLCKTCKRYWTEGGSLRNVPVGGCSRKNKKSAAAPSTSSKIPDLNPVLSLSQFSSQNPRAAREAQVLNLAFPTMDKKYHGLSQGNSSSSASSAPLPAFELLRTGNIASRGLNTYIPSPMLDTRTLYYSSAGFHLQEPKSTLGFSVDGLGTRYEIQGNSAKLFFPFGGSKQISSTNEVEPSKGQGISTGNWSHAMLNGGYW